MALAGLPMQLEQLDSNFVVSGETAVLDGVKRTLPESAEEEERPRKRARGEGKHVSWKPALQGAGGQEKDGGARVHVEERRVQRWLALVRRQGGTGSLPAETELAALSWREGVAALKEARIELLQSASERPWALPTRRRGAEVAAVQTACSAEEEARQAESIQARFWGGHPPQPIDRTRSATVVDDAASRRSVSLQDVPWEVRVSPLQVAPVMASASPSASSIVVPQAPPAPPDVLALLESLRRLLPLPAIAPPPGGSLPAFLPTVNSSLLQQSPVRPYTVPPLQPASWGASPRDQGGPPYQHQGHHHQQQHHPAHRPSGQTFRGRGRGGPLY